MIIGGSYPVTMINSVIANNSFSGNKAGSLFELQAFNPDNSGNYFTNHLVNNTIVDNRNIGSIISNGNGNVINDLINNILWDNDNPNFGNSNQSNTLLSHNIIQDNTAGEFLDEDNITDNPLFKNKGGGNYQLSRNSPAIDAGDKDDLIIVDHRGYYRTGTPDIGAFEAGASKYLLSLEDDIATPDKPIFLKFNHIFSKQKCFF